VSIYHPPPPQNANPPRCGWKRPLKKTVEAQNTDAERRACEIRLRAERKAGQLLAKTIKKGGDKKSKSAETTSILKPLGISKDQSSQWQKLGAMPSRTPAHVPRRPAFAKISTGRGPGPPARGNRAGGRTWPWQSSLAGILECGRLLLAAKDELPHGEFLAMVESDLPFGASTAQMLMKIARDPRLTNTDHGQHLPPSWRTLYELTKLGRRAIRGGPG